MNMDEHLPLARKWSSRAGLLLKRKIRFGFIFRVRVSKKRLKSRLEELERVVPIAEKKSVNLYGYKCE
jgi:hypothetical protein